MRVVMTFGLLSHPQDVASAIVDVDGLLADGQHEGLIFFNPGIERMENPPGVVQVVHELFG